MLSANVTETPRPRPPAKTRRSASLLKTATPPPSYAAAFTLTPEGKPRLDTLLGSPMPATFQRVGWDTGSPDRQVSPTSEEDMEWMKEKSQEELSELLVKADDLIKERETELGVASAVCKELYDNNVALKSKHQALLARLPSSPSPSPSPEPMSRTSSRYSISLSRPISEFDTSPLPSSFKGHARKISVSNAEISHLADQNAELLEKLERIESESFSADQSGRRVLKRLEKEISTLREELEKTQAKSEELEEKTRVGFGWDSEQVVQEVWRKKQEREARFRAMRNLGHNGDDEGGSEVRNFAPEGSVFGAPFSFFPPGDTPRRLTGTPNNRQPSAPAPFTPHPESTLISQLLEKIQELEETNVRIIEQQNETTNQLNAMQRETEHISKVYECFADENIIELASETDPPHGNGDRASRDETIRFRSFKRNLETQFSDSPNMDEFPRSLNISTTSRARKSVVGLFDGSEENNRGGSTPDQLRSFSLPIPFASSPRSEGHRSSRSVGSTGLVSPALSSLSLSPSPTHPSNPFNPPHRTLEAELGNEFKDGWGLSAGNPHLRTNSLYDLTQISAPPSPSPSPMSHQHSRSRSSIHEPDALPTPMSMGNSALRLSVEPPTPDKVPTAGRNRGDGPGNRSLRYHRMSETVKSRTSKWVDGRFKDTLTGHVSLAHVGNLPATSQPSTPMPQRLANAFDAVVDNVSGPAGRRSTHDSEDKKVQVEKGKPRGLGAIMLEFWLWLQFAIIILVFLWAMAKRGPKSVLGEAAHRRTVSSSH
ncbi:hypothetical protein Hypma_012834 [Hypsizygus marmoreus]|uniref:Uncharacterized protein n=1 Tax=Hypsizygus marmoreus TaxID=39966 RepID=A0A369JHS3_HYPMA|nr:hypothetical protein Hypma_012834 [Hypsizygus marmoreus]